MSTKENGFSGNRVYVGCIIYSFVLVGFMGLYVAGYSLYPETYNISISVLATIQSGSLFAGVIASLLYASVSKKIGIKGCMYVGITAVVLYGLVTKSIVYPVGILIAFCLSGIAGSLSSQVAVTQVVTNWFGKKGIGKVTIALAAGNFGQAAYQFVGGYLFTKFGLRNTMMIAALFSAVILLLTAKFLICAESPEKIGQKPLDEETQPQEASAVSTQPEKKEMPLEQKNSLYRNPTFWLTVVARFLGCGSIGYVVTYMTTFLTQAGMELSSATKILSMLTLATVVFMAVSGKLLQILQTKRFVILICVAACLANLSMILYLKVPSMLVLVLIAVCYSIGSGTFSAHNILSVVLFDKKDLGNANSKLYAVLVGGSIILTPIAGLIVQHLGFVALYIVAAVLNVLSMLMYFAAIASAKRQKMEV